MKTLPEKKMIKNYVIIKSTIIFLILFFNLATNKQTLLAQNKGFDLIVSLTGSVFNEYTKEPISINIEVLDEMGNKINRTRSNSAENGYYFITGLKPGKKYIFEFKDFAYFFTRVEYELPQSDKYSEFSKDFLVMPIRDGIEFPLSVAAFEYNKPRMRFGVEPFLENLVSLLKQNPRVKFKISCYPDSKNGELSNLELTKLRGEALIEYFKSLGIRKDRFSIQSNIEIDPKNPPSTSKSSKGKKYIGRTYFIISST